MTPSPNKDDDLMTLAHRPLYNLAYAFGLGFCLTLSLACDSGDPAEPLDEAAQAVELAEPSTSTPTWTADRVMDKATDEGIAIIGTDEISESEKQRLFAAADEIVEFDSEHEYERFLAFTQGQQRIVHSAPIGAFGEVEAHVHWDQVDEVIEHARIFEYLEQRSLIADIEAAVPTGTWLTEQAVREALPGQALDGLDSFEFDPFVAASEPLEITQAPAAAGCGVNVCTYGNCGDCHVTIALVLDQIVFIFYKHYWYHCADNCTCTDSGSYNGGC